MVNSFQLLIKLNQVLYLISILSFKCIKCLGFLLVICLHSRMGLHQSSLSVSFNVINQITKTLLSIYTDIANFGEGGFRVGTQVQSTDFT